MKQRDSVQKAIDAYLRRWRFACFVGDSARIAAAVLAGAGVLLTFSRGFSASGRFWVLLAVPGLVALCVRLMSLWKPERVRRAVLEMDERLHLKDALVTACEFVRSDAGDWDDLVFEDFLNRIEQVDVRRAFRLLPSTRTIAVLVLSALYLGVSGVVHTRPSTSPELLERLRQLAQEAERLSETSLSAQPGPRGRALTFRSLELLERLQQVPATVADEEITSLVSDLDLYSIQSGREDSSDGAGGSARTGNGRGSGTARPASETFEDLDVLRRALMEFREQIAQDSLSAASGASMTEAQTETDATETDEKATDSSARKVSHKVSRERVNIQTVLDAAVDEIPKRTYEIREEPIPWEQIPLWQQPIVQKYFSSEKDSQ